MTSTALVSGIKSDILAAIETVRDGAEAMYWFYEDGGIGISNQEYDDAAQASALARECFPALVALATHEDAEVCAAALHAIAEIVGPAGSLYPTPPADLSSRVARLLDSNDDKVCVAALQALYMIPAPETTRAISLLERDDYYVVSMAALVLRKAGCVSALTALERALPKSPAIISLALQALAPSRPVSVAALRAGCDLRLAPYSHHFDRDRYLDVGYELDTFMAYHSVLQAYSRALDLVLQTLDGALCPHILEAFGDCLDERAAPVVELFRRRKFHAAVPFLNQAVLVPGLRACAVEALQILGDKSSVPALAAAFADESNLWTKTAIGQRLAQLDHRAITASLMALYETVTEDVQRARLVEALSHDLNTETVRFLRGITTRHTAVRSALIAALSKFDASATIADLAKRPPDKALVDDLGEIKSAEVYPVLLGWYRQSEDNDLLRHIPYAIGRRRDSRSVPTLIEMFELQKAGPSRYDLVLALGEAGAEDFLVGLADEQRGQTVYRYNLITALRRLATDRAVNALEILFVTERRTGENASPRSSPASAAQRRCTCSRRSCVVDAGAGVGVGLLPRISGATSLLSGQAQVSAEWLFPRRADVTADWPARSSRRNWVFKRS